LSQFVDQKVKRLGLGLGLTVQQASTYVQLHRHLHIMSVLGLRLCLLTALYTVLCLQWFHILLTLFRSGSSG